MTRLLGIFAAAIVALGITAPKAEAAVIYDWTGPCESGCTGQATAVLTLADSYVPGTFLEDADFISFSYSSSSGAYDIPADAAFVAFFAIGPLPAVSGEAEIGLDFAGGGTGFFSDPLLTSWVSEFAPAGISESGTSHLWTLRQPPELSAPGPLSLLALGLAGLALAGRRRGKAGA